MEHRNRPVIAEGIERRRLDAAEFRVVRDDSGKLKMLSGYGAKYNARSLPLGWFEEFREVIAPGAFDETLAKGDDVRFLFNHDPNIVLGRTTSRTLRLSSDSIGLKFEVEPPDTQAARDIMTTIDRGDVSQCSFGFRTLDDDWSEDQSDGTLIRTLLKVALYDVSAVTYPAYPDTEVSVRSLEGLLEAGRRKLGKLPEQVKARMQERERRLRLAEVAGR